MHRALAVLILATAYCSTHGNIFRNLVKPSSEVQPDNSIVIKTGYFIQDNQHEDPPQFRSTSDLPDDESFAEDIGLIYDESHSSEKARQEQFPAQGVNYGGARGPPRGPPGFGGGGGGGGGGGWGQGIPLQLHGGAGVPQQGGWGPPRGWGPPQGGWGPPGGHGGGGGGRGKGKGKGKKGKGGKGGKKGKKRCKRRKGRGKKGGKGGKGKKGKNRCNQGHGWSWGPIRKPWKPIKSQPGGWHEVPYVSGTGKWQQTGYDLSKIGTGWNIANLIGVRYVNDVNAKAHLPSARWRSAEMENPNNYKRRSLRTNRRRSQKNNQNKL